MESEVFLLIKKHLVEILPELGEKEILPADSLRDLCPNSIDRMDVIVKTMESLQLNVPFTSFHGAKNIGDLALLFSNNVEKKQSSCLSDVGSVANLIDKW